MASDDKVKEHGRSYHKGGQHVLLNDFVRFPVTYRKTTANSKQGQKQPDQNEFAFSNVGLPDPHTDMQQTHVYGYEERIITSGASSYYTGEERPRCYKGFVERQDHHTTMS